MKPNVIRLKYQRVSPSLSRLLDAEEFGRRIATMVSNTRRRRYKSSWGSSDFDITATQVGSAAVVAPYATLTMEEMGLTLNPPIEKVLPISSNATTKSGLPFMNKRATLFANRGETKTPSQSLTGSAVKSLLMGRRSEQVAASATHTNFTATSTKAKSRVSDSVRQAIASFIKSQSEAEVKANGGMLIHRWEREDGAVNTINSLREKRARGPQPISAGFKQKFTDFAVVEIPEPKPGESPIPLVYKRSDKSFTIPPVPPHVLESLGMPTTKDNLFAPVDIQTQLKASTSMAEVKDDTASSKGGRRRVYVQAIVHKRRLPHTVTVRLLASKLGIRVQSISFAGIKDYVGNTVQHMRFEGVSPQQLRDLNSHFRGKGIRLELSNFSYEDEPLFAGQLYGNSFKIILRDIPQQDLERLKSNVAKVAEKGSLNYFGSQRFSFFGGKEDPIMAIIKGNWLMFAFQFLNYTDNPNLCLRKLLQRPLQFPNATINQYRHAIVDRLKALRIEPTLLDRYPAVFKRTPAGYDHHPLQAMKDSSSASHRTTSQPQLVLAALRSAFFDIQPRDRNMMVQAVTSFFWNQAVSARYNAFGDAVLEGDVVGVNSGDELALGVVTAGNKHMFTIEDVMLPSFTFGHSKLPSNDTAFIYHTVLERYHITWSQKIGALEGSLSSPPRKMIVKPQNVSLAISDCPEGGENNPSRFHATVSFTLTKGSYASVVVADILSLQECAGMKDTIFRPRPFAEWNSGKPDKRFVRTMEELYAGKVTEQEVSDEVVEKEEGEEDKPFELPISAAQSSSEAYAHSETNPFDEVADWSAYHLVKNGVRKRQEQDERRAQLFEHSLGSSLQHGELNRYIGGHNIPIAPNASARIVAKAMKKRGKLRKAATISSGPHQGARVRRSAMKKSYLLRPSYSLLNADTWNFK